MAGRQPVVRIPQVGSNPRYLGMDTNIWKPTFPVQSGSFWDQFLNSQLVPSSSQIPTHPSVPQQVQIHVSQHS